MHAVVPGALGSELVPPELSAVSQSVSRALVGSQLVALMRKTCVGYLNHFVDLRCAMLAPPAYRAVVRCAPRPVQRDEDPSSMIAMTGSIRIFVLNHSVLVNVRRPLRFVVIVAPVAPDLHASLVVSFRSLATTFRRAPQESSCLPIESHQASVLAPFPGRVRVAQGSPLLTHHQGHLTAVQ